MTKERKTYSKEFKLEALELARRADKSDSQVERGLGLSRGCLYNWRKKLEQDGAEAFPGKGNLKETAETIGQLKRELAIAQQERDVLKKALAIFTPSPRS